MHFRLFHWCKCKCRNIRTVKTILINGEIKKKDIMQRNENDVYDKGFSLFFRGLFNEFSVCSLLFLLRYITHIYIYFFIYINFVSRLSSRYKPASQILSSESKKVVRTNMQKKKKTPTTDTMNSLYRLVWIDLFFFCSFV